MIAMGCTDNVTATIMFPRTMQEIKKGGRDLLFRITHGNHTAR
jgi:hypothetical protein